ncbi:MAG: hydrolase 1, exosortase A system-associated, partial [Nitrosospira sp.]|nr:hydrolase 1, exosortase A system-associated [Nitrosospira sp.]
VRTQEGGARAYLKHYYAARLFQPELWNKIRRGNFNYAAAARSFSRIIGESLPGRNKNAAAAEGATCEESRNCTPLPNRMFHGLSHFHGKILVVISGNDLTAREFSDMIKSSRGWQKLLASPRVTHLNLPEANHTFSRREWRDQVAAGTTDWIYSW